PAPFPCMAPLCSAPTLFPYTTLFRSAMAICLLGCDAFYEAGFITISPGGRIAVVRHSNGSPELTRALARLSRRQCLESRARARRSEEHTSELQHVSISYAVFCLKKKI